MKKLLSLLEKSLNSFKTSPKQKIRALTEGEFRTEAKVAYDRVFQSEDPFAMPFKETMTHRVILYGYKHALDLYDLNAVKLAAEAIGDDSMYLSVLERPPEDEQDQPYHWLIPFEKISKSCKLPGPLENAIYSPRGRWGIIMSHEIFGIAGGDERFISVLCNNLYESCDEHVKKFLTGFMGEHERIDSDISWIPSVITHVYGKKEGTRLLKEVGFDIQ